MVDISRGSTLGSSGASELFQLLRDGTPRTRAELAATTGLARSTIALRVGELIDLGLVSPVNDAQSTGGRPSSQFALNQTARVVLAADLGATHATIAVANLSGKILTRTSGPIDIADGPESVLAWMVEVGRKQLDELGLKRSDVISIGIGFPAPSSMTPGAQSIRRSCPAGTASTYPPGFVRTSTFPCSSTTTSTSWRSASRLSPGRRSTTSSS